MVLGTAVAVALWWRNPLYGILPWAICAMESPDGFAALEPSGDPDYGRTSVGRPLSGSNRVQNWFSCIAPFAACGHFKIQAGVAAFWPGRPFAQNVLPHLNFDVTCLQPARYNLVRLAPAQELRTALPRG